MDRALYFWSLSHLIDLCGMLEIEKPQEKPEPTFREYPQKVDQRPSLHHLQGLIDPERAQETEFPGRRSRGGTSSWDEARLRSLASPTP
uniref:Uncharacterized protein n=1 Tax=Steinernema glaseri TaxID=37863 RepID=A0A1I8A6M6_9BILA